MDRARERGERALDRVGDRLAQVAKEREVRLGNRELVVEADMGAVEPVLVDGLAGRAAAHLRGAVRRDDH